MRRIGILGGSFDPLHIGHLILADYATDALGLAQLLFVPAADPPHKQHEAKTPVEHRLAMIALALNDDPRFLISLADVERPGPHYSLDMVRLIQQQHPGDELYFVMGGDSLRDLPRWHHPKEFMQSCKLAVMRRLSDNVHADMHETVLPGLAERVTMIDAPIIGISSTDIVERIQHSKSVRYLLPPGLWDYIAAHRLYGLKT